MGSAAEEEFMDYTGKKCGIFYGFSIGVN